MPDDSTPRWMLPLLHPGQAQKEMYHNEALAGIDLVLNASAEALGTDTPPEDPVPGACWIVGAAPTGAWTGQADALVGWTGAGWRFAAPTEGMQVWLSESHEYAQFSAGSWAAGMLHGRLSVDGVQVVGPQCDAVADPAGGTTVDAEARAALAAALAALRSHGLIAD